MKHIESSASQSQPSFKAEDFICNTQRNVVYTDDRKPRNFSYDNPDPYGYFPGRKGDPHFYLINWSDDLTEYTNCYAFACGWTVKKELFSGIYQPGFLCGLDPETRGQYADAIVQDLKAVGREVYEIYDSAVCPKKLPKAEKGSYWIKLVFAGEDHFHILRKDEHTGKWIHKPGWNSLPRVVLKFKFGKDNADGFETKYENKDTADYVGYDKISGTFIEYKFAYMLRIQE